MLWLVPAEFGVDFALHHRPDSLANIGDDIAGQRFQLKPGQFAAFIGFQILGFSTPPFSLEEERDPFIRTLAVHHMDSHQRNNRLVEQVQTFETLYLPQLKTPATGVSSKKANSWLSVRLSSRRSPVEASGIRCPVDPSTGSGSTRGPKLEHTRYSKSPSPLNSACIASFAATPSCMAFARNSARRTPGMRPPTPSSAPIICAILAT